MYGVVSICLLNTAVFSVRTAEPVEMPFGLSTQTGARNHELGRSLDPHGKGHLWEGHTWTYTDFPVVDILNITHKGAEAMWPPAASPL